MTESRHVSRHWIRHAGVPCTMSPLLLSTDRAHLAGMKREEVESKCFFTAKTRKEAKFLDQFPICQVRRWGLGRRPTETLDLYCTALLGARITPFNRPSDARHMGMSERAAGLGRLSVSGSHSNSAIDATVTARVSRCRGRRCQACPGDEAHKFSA